MSEIRPSSANPRTPPPAETPVRVNRVAGVSGHPDPQHRDRRESVRREFPSPERETHHDPAVSLAPSLARIACGTIMTGLIDGVDADGRALFVSAHATYVIEAPAILQTRLTRAASLTVEIMAAERTIIARAIAIDRDPVRTEMIVTLVLVGIDAKAPDTSGLHTERQEAPLPAAPLPSPLGPWPMFENLLAVLHAADPVLARTLETELPTPARLVTPLLLLCLDIREAADPAQLFPGPDGEDALRRAGRGELPRLLEEEFASLKRLSRTRPDGEWRPFLIPLWTEHGVQALPLVIRQTRAASGDFTSANESRIIRLVLDFILQGQGRVQLDGMIRAREFHLVLRCERPLQETQADAARALFQSALEQRGLTGDMTCVFGAAFPSETTAAWPGQMARGAISA